MARMGKSRKILLPLRIIRATYRQNFHEPHRFHFVQIQNANHENTKVRKARNKNRTVPLAFEIGGDKDYEEGRN